MLSDLNSRVGTIQEIILDHNLISDSRDEIINCDTIIVQDDLINNDMSIIRSNMDLNVNSFGKQLVELCQCADLVILNGRSPGDRDGKFTYIDIKGNSTIDLAIVSKNVLYLVENFKVHDPNAFSDHVLISLSLKCNAVNPIGKICTVCNSKKSRLKWKDDEKENFINLMNDAESTNNLNYISKLLDNEINETNLSSCLTKFSDTFSHAAQVHMNKKNIDKNDNSYYPENWYDVGCKLKKKEFDLASNIYKETCDPGDKQQMCVKRNEYRKLCRLKRKHFIRKRADEFLHLSKYNPKKFWKKIKDRDNKAIIGKCNFFEHFKQLNATESKLGTEIDELIDEWEANHANLECIELDDIISMNELKSALKDLKNDKSCGYDNVLNEFMKYNTDLCYTVLLKLFNTILSSGVFPLEWAIGEIIPLLKKGDINNPDNYRGITIISCMGKLFTSILNNRLNEWAEQNDIFNDCQFGFRKNRSTTDCIFMLNGLIEHFRNHSKPLFACFVDLTKAFDSASRKAMWFKLYQNKVSTKISNVIKNMYEKIKLCVRENVDNCHHSNSPDTAHNNGGNDVNESSNDHGNNNCFFKTSNGVCQGESLSPFLFSMFLNDIDSFLRSDYEVGLSVFQLFITAIIFADDMVLLSDNRKGLQRGLDKLSDYCSAWGLTVNVSKTKCMAFKKNGKISKLDSWTYREEKLETTNCFKYLGFTFGSTGSYTKGTEALLAQAKRALFGLNTFLVNNKEISPHIKLSIFNSVVTPILTYGSEVWGYKNCDKMDVFYLGFLKYVLGVKKSTPNCTVYSEMGTESLFIKRVIRVIKYWLKILKLDCTNPVKIVYDILCNDCAQDNLLINWVSGVKHILFSNGFGYIWIQQSVINEKQFLSEFKLRIKDIFIQRCNDEISNLSDNRLYKHLGLTNNAYLTEIKQNYIRTAITRLKMSSHTFMNERGRWLNIEYNLRLCSLCHVLEDEFHIINVCPRYTHLREKYIPRNVYQKPSMIKLIDFINTSKKNRLKNMGIFCHKVFEMYRNDVLFA